MKTIVEKMEEEHLTKDPHYSLRKSFFKAKENPDFVALISNLKNVREDVLMNYTSLLEDAALEFHNCENCRGLDYCANQLKGCAYLPQVKDGNLIFDYQACRFQKALLKEEEPLKYIFMFHMPEAVRKAKMKDIYPNDQNRFEVIKWLSNFIKSYEHNPKQKGLYLYGNFGAGKSYLIAALFNELAKKKVQSAIIFWPEYLQELKASFNGEFGQRNFFKEKMQFLMHVPLLLIDDIGAENMTAWSRDEVFCPLIQARMDENLPTFFTSNLDLASLEAHFALSKDKFEEIKARRIIERIKQLTESKEMLSKNLRK